MFIGLWGRCWKWISTSHSNKLLCPTSQDNPKTILSPCSSYSHPVFYLSFQASQWILLFFHAFLKYSSFSILQKYELKSPIFLTGLPGLGVGICSKVLFFKIGIRNFRILHFLILSPPLVQAMCHSKKKEGEKKRVGKEGMRRKKRLWKQYFVTEGRERKLCLSLTTMVVSWFIPWRLPAEVGSLSEKMLPWLFSKQIFLSNLACFFQNLFPDSVPYYSQVTFKARRGEAYVAMVHSLAKQTNTLETCLKIYVAVPSLLIFIPVQLLHSSVALKWFLW